MNYHLQMLDEDVRWPRSPLRRIVSGAIVAAVLLTAPGTAAYASAGEISNLGSASPAQGLRVAAPIVGVIGTETGSIGQDFPSAISLPIGSLSLPHVAPASEIDPDTVATEAPLSPDVHAATFLSRATLEKTSLAVLAGLSKDDPRDLAAAQFDGKSVLILGAGIGGMTAAHELAERGFDVRIVDHGSVPGGKARSVDVPDSGTAGRKNLSGEHGFRIFPSFYDHFYDTLGRIPGSDGRPAIEQLFLPAMFWIARDRARDPVGLPTGGAAFGNKFHELLSGAIAVVKECGGSLPDAEIRFFAKKMLYVLTSSPARRLTELESLSWWDYLEADSHSDDYQKVFALGTARAFLAMKPTVASARIVGELFIQFLQSIGSTKHGGVDKMLMGPSNAALFDPWQKYLESEYKARFLYDTEAVSFNMSRGKIESVTVRGPQGERRLKADYYLSALPVDVMQRMTSPEMVRSAPALSNLSKLHSDTMIGLQLYLRERLPLPASHAFLLDSPWAIALVYNQTQAWKDYSLGDVGDGTTKSVVSITFGDVDKPGIVFGKPLTECSEQEIVQEAIAQIDRHLGPKNAGFIEKNLQRHHLDPAVRFDGGRTWSTEPLFINSVGSHFIRPQAQTQIPNLVLSADYVLSDFEVSSTMEAANAAGRKAAIAVLDGLHWKGNRPRLFRLKEPALFRALQALDRLCFKLGLPNPFALFF